MRYLNVVPDSSRFHVLCYVFLHFFHFIFSTYLVLCDNIYCRRPVFCEKILCIAHLCSPLWAVSQPCNRIKNSQAAAAGVVPYMRMRCVGCNIWVSKNAFRYSFNMLQNKSFWREIRVLTILTFLLKGSQSVQLELIRNWVASEEKGAF